MHVFLLPTYTITYVGLSVEVPSSGSDKKLTGASFFIDTSAHLNTLKRTSLTKSCMYLKPRSSLQWNACSLKVSMYALRKTWHTSSIGNNGKMRRYRRIVWYSIDEICWFNPSLGMARRKSWACVACKHPKIIFYLVVMSNFTSISWTLLLKRALAKTCFALGGTISLLVKLLLSKAGIVSHGTSMTWPKLEFISLIHYLWKYDLVVPKIGPWKPQNV